MRESNVNQNRVGPRDAWLRASANAFALYVAMYTFGRVFFEWLRVDPASRIFGIRFNLLLSAALCVTGIVLFVWFGRTQPPAITRGEDAATEPGSAPTPHQEYSG